MRFIYIYVYLYIDKIEMDDTIVNYKYEQNRTVYDNFVRFYIVKIEQIVYIVGGKEELI